MKTSLWNYLSSSYLGWLFEVCLEWAFMSDILKVNLPEADSTDGVKAQLVLLTSGLSVNSPSLGWRKAVLSSQG